MRAAAILLALFWGVAVNQKNKEGAELYRQGKLDDALRAFTEAQIESPDAPEIHYNIGNVHFKKGEFDKATAEYRAALRGNPEVVKRSHYATGNVHFRKQDLDSAVQAYKAALRVDPNDLETRQNFELSLRHKEAEETKGEQGGGGSEQNRSDEKKPSQQHRQQGKGASPQDEAQPQRQDTQNASPRGISKEEAERLLAAIAQMERAEQHRQQQKVKVRAPARGKDW